MIIDDSINIETRDAASYILRYFLDRISGENNNLAFTLDSAPSR
jgi:hypothetical protein